MPEALAGFEALEHALGSAKWVVANSEAAQNALEAALAQRGAALGDFNAYQQRLRHLRNDVLAHLDRDFFNGKTQSVTVDAAALYLHTLNDRREDWHEWGYDEWEGWLAILETWMEEVAALELPASGRAGRNPFDAKPGAPPAGDTR